MAKRLPIYREAVKTNASEMYQAREFEERHGNLNLSMRAGDLRKLAKDLNADDLRFLVETWGDIHAPQAAMTHV